MDTEAIPIQEAVAAVQRVAERNRPTTELDQARLSAELDDALLMLADAVEHCSDDANTALDLLVRHLNAHANVTWYLARWWDVQSGPVTTGFAALSTRRWLDVMAALRAALEM